MRWLNLVDSMPKPVAGLTLLFLIVPAVSSLALHSPAHVLEHSGWLAAALYGATFWLLPMGISFSLLLKHHWFLPLYFLQCIFLTVHTLLSQSSSVDILIARILLVGMMVYVGILLGNKNFLYPLLTRQFRVWRRAVRFRIGRTVTVSQKLSEFSTSAVLFDASTTGLQLSLQPEGLEGGLSRFPLKTRLEVFVPGEETRPAARLLVEVAWAGESDGRIRVGCRALDRKLMRAYVATEFNKQAAVVRLPIFKGFTIDQDIQEAALVLWLACIALSFALPALA